MLLEYFVMNELLRMNPDKESHVSNFNDRQSTISDDNYKSACQMAQIETPNKISSVDEAAGENLNKDAVDN